MRQFLRLVFLPLFISMSANCQNNDVMSATDNVYQYDPNAADGTATNPTTTYSKIIKWIHDDTQRPGRITLDQNKFKCYFYNSIAFRLRFPNNYDPANPAKYPLVIFLHGGGEATEYVNLNPHNAPADAQGHGTVNRENQDQLFNGAETFDQRIEQGEWNGFLLFPQIFNNASVWNENYFPRLNDIMDTLVKYNGVDPDRIITMGLSAGAIGSANYAASYPTRISSALISNPPVINGLAGQISNLLQIPIWLANGGQDIAPSPTDVANFRDAMAAAGGNIYEDYYPTGVHNSWNTQWAKTDIFNKFILSTYWNNAHKAQPLVYYQNTSFCAGTPFGSQLGITAGFYAYEWQYNNGSGFTNIPGAIANIYTATQAGSYRVHFKRSVSAGWSAWSPNPIVITTKACSADTLFAEHFDGIPLNPYIAISGGSPTPGPYKLNNYTCQNGIFINATEVFSQDGAGRLGGQFMVNNTSNSPLCNYYGGDEVWHSFNTVPVEKNTDYMFSFYMGNQTSLGPAVQLNAIINTTTLSPVNLQTLASGDLSWKKYSFIWNSGNATTADLIIKNYEANDAGNDFVLDEISLVKYKAPPMPGGFSKPALWAKAGTIKANDNNVVRLWTNNIANENSLLQPNWGYEPALKINAADNINFNPVVAYNAATKGYNFVPYGFSGTTVHTAAHIYAVLKFNSLSASQTVVSESHAGGFLDINTEANGAMRWYAGTSDNILTTANNTNEVNKPVLWTFSKDNTNNTADGNKQDIRKNGILLASDGHSTVLIGTGNHFNIGTYDVNAPNSSFFDGSLAEIIYLRDANINAANENKIESYLAIKYGTSLGNPANLRNYTASNGTVFWTGNTTYQNDVFGIGTDSASALVQAISNSVNSGSGNGNGQPAKGNLVIATNTVLRDNRFLMMGNDAGPLAEHIIVAGEANTIAVGSTRLGRTWKVANTGTVGAIDLSFDTTGLKNQAGASIPNNYALMIDNDKDGNFNTGTLSFFTATSGTGKKINFSGVTLNDGVVFTIITLKSASLLPAIWLGFTAEAVNGNALLNWKTSDEMNVDRYIAEHSFNGVSFTPIASVTANNNTGTNQYTFTDKGLAPGMHYYRIRRIDKDGRGEYSDTKSVKITTVGANVLVRPNPVTGTNLVLAITVPQNSKTTIQLMSADGKTLLLQKLNLSTGNNLVNLDIATVPKGVYLVQVQLSDEVVTKKFIRQ